MKKCRVSKWGAMLLLSCWISPACAQDFKALSAYVEKTKAATEMPSGTAVAIVKDGKIIHEAYFGFADIERELPVTRDTVFYIASATKPFVALDTLLMAKRGKLDTQMPLQQMFPDLHFRALEADRIRLEDLLVHRSGIDNQPLVWATAFSGIHDAGTRRALIGQSYPDAKASLGTFKYSNVGYNIVSVWLDQAFAKPWQKQLEENVFQPLHMQRTSAHISEAERKKWSLAKPYSYASAKPGEALYLRKHDDTLHAAGGMLSTAADLSSFLLAQMNAGSYQGRQVFPAGLIRQSQMPQVKAEGSYLDFKRSDYAWGWYRGEYKGRNLLHHFGSFAGFHAHMSFMPEQRIGLVVLNNEDVLSARLTNLIADHVYGVLLDEPGIEAKMSDRFDELVQQARDLRTAMAKQRDAMQKRDWHLSLPREAYAGTYSNEWLGDIQVRLPVDGNLYLDWGRLSSVATAYEAPENVRVEFSPNNGDVLSFEVNAERVEAISFANARFERKQDP